LPGPSAQLQGRGSFDQAIKNRQAKGRPRRLHTQGRNTMPKRTDKGHFRKGESGNPGGRPKLPAEMRKAFQARAPEVLQGAGRRCKEGTRSRYTESPGRRGNGTPTKGRWGWVLALQWLRSRAAEKKYGSNTLPHEPDDGVAHFARWRPFNQDAVSRSAVQAPACEDDGGDRGR
jgi:hypothetical protein